MKEATLDKRPLDTRQQRRAKKRIRKKTLRRIQADPNNSGNVTGWKDVTERAKRSASAPDGLVSMYANATYTVQVYGGSSYMDSNGKECKIESVAVRRNDERAVRDWSALQKIKNALFGTFRLAIEFYPPEALLVDEANIRWLWVFPEGKDLGFGFNMDKKPERKGAMGSDDELVEVRCGNCREKFQMPRAERRSILQEVDEFDPVSFLCNKCNTPDHSRHCTVCCATPVHRVTGMCGPCTFGEMDTANGTWWGDGDE